MSRVWHHSSYRSISCLFINLSFSVWVGNASWRLAKCTSMLQNIYNRKRLHRIIRSCDSVKTFWEVPAGNSEWFKIATCTMNLMANSLILCHSGSNRSSTNNYIHFTSQRHILTLAYICRWGSILRLISKAMMSWIYWGKEHPTTFSFFRYSCLKWPNTFGWGNTLNLLNYVRNSLHHRANACWTSFVSFIKALQVWISLGIKNKLKGGLNGGA